LRVRRQLLEDADAHHLEHALRDLHRALLVFHAPTDSVVGVDNARRIFDAAKHPESFVSLDDADHLLTRPEDANYVAAVLAAWASRYLPRASPPLDTTPRADEGLVVVTESGSGRLTQTIRARQHRLRADEPLGVGDDTGPTPYELLLAALGACTSMTVRMYADRQRWPLERVDVRLTHQRIHADDCRGALRTPCTVDHIERVLELSGPLSDEQRARLLAIAERCPVHRTLTGEIRVTTSLL
jgi:putative redox protein